MHVRNPGDQIGCRALYHLPTSGMHHRTLARIADSSVTITSMLLCRLRLGKACLGQPQGQARLQPGALMIPGCVALIPGSRHSPARCSPSSSPRLSPSRVQRQTCLLSSRKVFALSCPTILKVVHPKIKPPCVPPWLQKLHIFVRWLAAGFSTQNM